jgi:hypothetical protein
VTVGVRPRDLEVQLQDDLGPRGPDRDAPAELGLRFRQVPGPPERSPERQGGGRVSRARTRGAAERLELRLLRSGLARPP